MAMNAQVGEHPFKKDEFGVIKSIGVRYTETVAVGISTDWLSKSETYTEAPVTQQAR
jgi:hypothetical protein